MAQQTKQQYHRELAYRVFAHEIRDTTLVIERDAEEQYAPQYIMTPTGAKINRVFIVGALTDIEDIGRDDPYWRARITDPTGTHVMYAGEYQLDATRVLSTSEIPEILGVVGKTAVYLPEGEDTDPVISIRPETVVKLDEAARDRWIMETARQTLGRIQTIEEYHPDSVDNMKQYREMVRAALTEVLEG